MSMPCWIVAKGLASEPLPVSLEPSLATLQVESGHTDEPEFSWYSCLTSASDKARLYIRASSITPVNQYGEYPFGAPPPILIGCCDLITPLEAVLLCEGDSNCPLT